jgi:hypothetical protein
MGQMANVENVAPQGLPGKPNRCKFSQDWIAVFGMVAMWLGGVCRVAMQLLGVRERTTKSRDDPGQGSIARSALINTDVSSCIIAR